MYRAQIALVILFGAQIVVDFAASGEPESCRVAFSKGREEAARGYFTHAQATLRESVDRCGSVHRQDALHLLQRLQSVWQYIFWRSLRQGDLPPLDAPPFLRMDERTQTLSEAKRLLERFRYPRSAARERSLRLLAPATVLWAYRTDMEALRRVRLAASDTSTETLLSPGEAHFRVALEFFRDASRADPFNPIYIYHIALSLQRLGRFRDAKMTYERLFRVEAYPDVHWLHTYHQLNDALGIPDERALLPDYDFWNRRDRRPEKTIAPDNDNDEDDKRRTVGVLTRMKNVNVVFAGIARDVADHLRERIIPLLERTVAIFGDYAVLLYENDSSDSTLAVLREWRARNPRVLAMSERRNAPPAVDFGIWDKGRFEALARARNAYLTALRETPTLRSFDVLVVLDTHTVGNWSIHGLANAVDRILRKDERLDIVCANGQYAMGGRKYYDGLAFRSLGYAGSLRDHLLSMTQILSRHVEPDEALHRADSCFGGMAAYRIETLVGNAPDCWYSGADESGKPDCEHANFHACLRVKANAIIAMDPGFSLWRG